MKRNVKKIPLDDIVFNTRDNNLKLAVKTHHAFADRFKSKLDGRPGIEFPWDSVLSISRKEFIDFYGQVYEWADNLKEEELDRWVYNPCLPDKGPDMSRLWRYNNAAWSIETVPLKEIGVWPRYFEVDHFLTTGNVIETAKGIEEYLKSNRADDMVTQKAINKAKSMIKYGDLIFQLFPLILIEAGENTRRAIENKNDEVQRRGLVYQPTKYDTEDGAGRAVDLALSGIKEARCFVGRGLQEAYPSKDAEANLLKSLS